MHNFLDGTLLFDLWSFVHRPLSVQDAPNQTPQSNEEIKGPEQADFLKCYNNEISDIDPKNMASPQEDPRSRNHYFLYLCSTRRFGYISTLRCWWLLSIGPTSRQHYLVSHSTS